MAKVFLSYNHSDRPFVDELYRRLTRDGVTCFYDQESIAWGDNWVLGLEAGLDQCEFIVFVLTPAFVASKWTEVERTATIADDPDGTRSKIRPLLLSACEFPRFLKNIKSIDVTTNEKFEQQYAAICQSLGGTMQTDQLPVERSQLPPVVQLPQRHRMPYRSLGHRFAGRVDAIWELHDLLSQGTTAVVEGVGVVMGTGGLGKTQLATEYAHRFAGYYPGGVFWADADKGQGIAIQQIAEGAEVGIDGALPVEAQWAQLWHILSMSPTRTLIIFDNFPETLFLQPWLPVGANLHTLVTTRRKDLNHAKLSLPFLSEAEGIALLNGGERTFGQKAAALVNELGGLPLALELAGNFLNLRAELSIVDMLEELQKLGEIEALELFAEHYGDELPTGHEKAVGATFQLSWGLGSQDAQRILKLMALWAPVPVPRRLLRQAYFAEADSILTDPVEMGVAELARLSLVELDEDADPQAHRLIAGFVRTVMAEDNTLMQQAVDTVATELGRVQDDHDTAALAELEKVLLHGQALLDAEFTTSSQASEIADAIRWHHRKQGRYQLAKQFGEQALAIVEQSFEPGHPSIATSQSNLAVVLKDLGDLEGARALLTSALASDEQSFEPGHPSIAIRQSNLAVVLQDLGDLEGARALLTSVLASNEQSFESGHPSIAISQSNLALVLKDLGDLDGARVLLTSALASNEQSFEPGHPKIATRQSNLAVVLQDLGDLDGARALLTSALASNEQSFEPGHPSIAIGQSNLAGVLKDLGDLDGARVLLTSALASDEQSFEPGHPRIATRQSNLAGVLKDLGDLDGARVLLTSALASDEQSFEPGHPRIAISQSNLAVVLQNVGDPEGARVLLTSALASDEQSFEPGHPKIATRQSNLAGVLHDLGDLEGAKGLLGASYKSLQTKLGESHPKTQTVRENLLAIERVLEESEGSQGVVISLGKKIVTFFS